MVKLQAWQENRQGKKKAGKNQRQPLALGNNLRQALNQQRVDLINHNVFSFIFVFIFLCDAEHPAL